MVEVIGGLMVVVLVMGIFQKIWAWKKEHFL
jgi:hypothetical protein